MKKFNKLILLLASASLFASACHMSDAKNQAEPNKTTSHAEKTTEINELVSFEEDTKLLKMEPKLKEKTYKQLDQMESYSEDPIISPHSMSNIQTIEDQKAYENVIKASYHSPQLIYIGFNECPYCRNFLPKLNQLAKELSLTYYYYNTNERVNDNNFRDLVDNYFKVSTVPQLFLIKDGQIDRKLENTNSMAELEAFLLAAK
ncbi:thioredoxin family protein [Facklamia miroungae]|uniref:Bacteriocin transport accessory protein, putative n=1 Tax=Facklamia miroungae TaxID=120956 RepID=A0A1G7T2C1_9LACT|nr:thioredoxin family protein [Facklamia miroungae]NKZ29459.1 thioredoxin family protein [Facklamia miroungae]SDG28809.1 bacteriocin transport accessory protein, putative [Facklamia miroungae]